MEKQQELMPSGGQMPSENNTENVETTAMQPFRSSKEFKKKPRKNKYHDWTKYTDTEKIKAVAIYMEIPNASRVEEMTGIPAQTIRAWKMQPWWKDVEDKILREQDQEITSRFTRIVQKAQEKVVDRLENGDWVLLKSGQSVRRPISGRDLTYIAREGIHNRQLLLDRPTSRSETVSAKDKLANLFEEFQKYSKAKDITPEDEGEHSVGPVGDGPQE